MSRLNLRRSISTAILISNIFLASTASAQFGSWVDKAKKKAQEAQDKLNGKTTASPSTTTPATSPSTSPSNTPSASANPSTQPESTAAPAAASAPVKPSIDTSSGKPVYTYCFLTVTGQPQAYMSEVLQVNFVTRDILYKTTVVEFRKFVAAKYHVVNATGRSRGSMGCEDGWVTEAEARTKKTIEEERLKSNPSTANIIETGFTASATEISQGDVAAAAPTDLKAAIQAEQPRVMSYCETNTAMMQSVNCQCLAKEVLTTRMNGKTTFAKSSSGHTIMEPQLSTLVTNVDLRACMDSDKITTSVKKQVTNTLQGYPEGKLQSIATCLAMKLLGQMKSDPNGIVKRDHFFSQDLTDCNMANQ